MDLYASKKDDVSKAILFYMQNRRGHFIKGAPVQFYKDFTFWKERMDTAQLHVWNKYYKDALVVFDKPKGKNRGSGISEMDFILYQDPPYFGTECVYKNGSFLTKDHDILARINQSSKNHVFLSYNDCPEVRELYKGWYMLEMETYYKMTNEIKKELFLSNMPLVRRTKAPTQSKVI